MFNVGMKVMISDDYSWFNGKIGIIVKINPTYNYPYTIKFDDYEDRPFKAAQMVITGKLTEMLYV